MPYYVYILTNRTNTVLYTGYTSNLTARIETHKAKMVPGFTARYNVDRLVYYEVAEELESAREREVQIKNRSRKWKMELIDAFNPTWVDL
ncbi:MAG: GIY-YIG nuclease family protein, partial [Dehalococcoidia bacterium]